MSHRSLDGTLVIARLRRSLFGGSVYTDVTIRDAGSQQHLLGTMLAFDGVRQAMAPGTRGRFYVYDVLGLKGVYGFRTRLGEAGAHFPLRWTAMTSGLGILNLLVALGWYLIAGSLAILAVTVGAVGLALGGVFLATRVAALRAFWADAPAAGRSKLRPCSSRT